MLVYMEVMTNIPLMHHASIVQTVKTIGGNLGFHHYERHTANRMVQHMSSIMHGKLLHYIKNSDTLSSIIERANDQTEETIKDEHELTKTYLQAQFLQISMDHKADVLNTMAQSRQAITKNLMGLTTFMKVSTVRIIQGGGVKCPIVGILPKKKIT